VEARVNYALVGLFVVVLAGALFGTVTWLVAGPGEAVYQPYVAYMSESVSGLSPKGSVKYRGVEVGRVRTITLDRDNPERVRLLLDIEQGTPVKVDTVAVLATQGITGLAYVELTGGRREAEPLRPTPEKPIPEIPTAPSLLVRIDTAVTTLMAQLGTATVELGAVAARVSELLGGDGVAAAAGTLHNLERITRVLAERVDDLGEGIREGKRVLETWARASQDLPELVARLKDGAAAAHEALGQIGGAAAGVDRMVAETRRELIHGSGEAMAELQGLLVELQGLARTLQRFAADLESDPKMLLFGRRGREPGPGE
jgi:phospholipid/cholesterol/gamma-HCH transport system substrate-binding protein